MIVRRSAESMGHELRPPASDSLRGPTTPAILAKLSWVSPSSPRGMMNCWPASGSEAGRTTPTSGVGDVAVADTAEGVVSATGELLAVDAVSAELRASRGVAVAITPASTPATTVTVAATTHHARLRLEVAGTAAATFAEA